MKEITDKIGFKHMSDKISDTNKITISGIRESMHLKFDVPGFAKKNKGPHFRILKLDNKITVKEYRFTKGCFKLTKNHLEIDIDKILQNVEKEKIRIERCKKDKAAFDFKLQLMNIKLQEWFENYETIRFYWIIVTMIISYFWFINFAVTMKYTIFIK